MNDIDVRSKMTRELFEELASKFLDRAKEPLSQVRGCANAGEAPVQTNVYPPTQPIFCCIELQQHNGFEQTCSSFCLLCGHEAVSHFCFASFAWSIAATSKSIADLSAQSCQECSCLLVQQHGLCIVGSLTTEDSLLVLPDGQIKH